MTKKKSSGKPKIDEENRKLNAHVTHLEMTHAPTFHFPVPNKPALALIKAEHMPVDYYRFIYEMVGRPYHWQERRMLSDAELAEFLDDENIQISILYAEGCPAGFFELDLGNLPDEVGITYFGLSERFQGLGIGKWFLATAIRTAWSHRPEKLTVHTNTLDHPAALPLYQKLGFHPVAVSDELISPWPAKQKGAD